MVVPLLVCTRNNVAAQSSLLVRNETLTIQNYVTESNLSYKFLRWFRECVLGAWEILSVDDAELHALCAWFVLTPRQWKCRWRWSEIILWHCDSGAIYEGHKWCVYFFSLGNLCTGTENRMELLMLWRRPLCNLLRIVAKLSKLCSATDSGWWP